MYVREHYPWILLFIFFNIFILITGLIDTTIPSIAVIYIVVINSVVLIIFCIWDYTRQRQFYKDIKTLNTHDDIDAFHAPKTPLQREGIRRLMDLQQNHQNMLDKESRKTRENLDELTRFIHDMKMPLTTMNLMIQDVKSDDKHKLSAEMNRLDGMLNEALYMKRLPNIKNDLYFEKVELEGMINQIIRKMQPICISKGIGFDIDLSAGTVHSDIKWLSFMISQVISNSIKYSSDSDIEIHSYQVNGQDMIDIKDYGRGIKDEDIDRIFDAGFTSTSHHDNDEATGMGMYLAKNVADALNIKLEVTSRYSEWTMVRLRLPHQNKFTQITSR